MLKSRNVRDFVIITLGTVIIAAAVYFFMIPSHVSVGSGAALAMVLILPVVLLVWAMQKDFISGMAMGSVKE